MEFLGAIYYHHYHGAVENEVLKLGDRQTISILIKIITEPLENVNILKKLKKF
jgi:hypothetical protein